MTKHECAGCREIVLQDRAVCAHFAWDGYNTVLIKGVSFPWAKRYYYCAWCWAEKGLNQTPNVIETRAGIPAPNPSRSDGIRDDGLWDNAVRASEEWSVCL